ncbi:MAG TPA: DnaA/Hda family protein [Burkholderiales bacterium]|nr:DnaA/Hda family protein [Burkholderiales bacterium]
MKQPLLDLFDYKPTFNNFMPMKNEIISASLQSFSSQFTHIIGEPLSGKTHLLKSWVNLAHMQSKTSIYLDYQEFKTNTENSNNLYNIADNNRFIAIDNIDLLDDNQQILLFDLFNYIKLNAKNNYLLTSSKINLEHCKVREDLKTRIQSGLNLNLKALDDNNLLQALEIYIRKEGIKISHTELNYLMNHFERNIGHLINAIHKISSIALIKKRNITIPLIKEAFLY